MSVWPDFLGALPDDAARIQLDFWDPEPGYYLNGTFYGDRNILAVAAAAQMQGEDRTAYNVDFLLERKGAKVALLTTEGQWSPKALLLPAFLLTVFPPLTTVRQDFAGLGALIMQKVLLAIEEMGGSG